MNRLSKSQTIKALTELRDSIARKTGQEGFKVLQYKTIEAIANALPATLEELRAIKGIGDKKLKQYGELILETIHSDRFNNDVPATKEPEQAEKPPVYTVGQFLDAVNGLLFDRFGNTPVRGEITGLNEHATGVYFMLKDKEDGSIMDCYLPLSVYRSLGVPFADGMEVKATGTPAVWKPRGRLSFRVDALELLGEGALKQAYELLKQKLEAEGLYIRKRPLPEFIGSIGIVTSRTGAVINDFRNNLMALGLNISLYDVRVEGARAVEEIRRGIKWFNDNQPDLDVLVVMRGGGSLEDLQAFNNEQIARTIFASGIPTIAGIGHDRDMPIASLVADAAVSTPTAAAVLINNSWQRLTEELPRREQALIHGLENALSRARYGIEKAGYIIDNYFERIKNRLDAFTEKLKQGLHALETACLSHKLKIEKAGQFLAGADPERNLRLGYSIVRNRGGKVVRTAADVKVGESISTKLYRGELESKVEEIK